MGNINAYTIEHLNVNEPRKYKVKAFPNKIGHATYDPMLGFPNGRKERVMVATLKEMEDANVPLLKRDYCAHLYIPWKKCFIDNYPKGTAKCKHESHEYAHCQHEDFLMRKKEYERERRLHEREQKKKSNPETLIEGEPL